jgi:hypothetical protein
LLGLAASRAISSAGRAPPRQGGGHWFEPSIAHAKALQIAGLLSFIGLARPQSGSQFSGGAFEFSVRTSGDAHVPMDPIIWAAIIAGGVSAIGNATTFFVARFGLRAQREQMTTTARVELAKVEADAERQREERREGARRDRREVYARLLSAIGRLQEYGGDDPLPTDEQFDRAGREFEEVLSETLLAGAERVVVEATNVLEAVRRILSQMHRFDGGAAACYRAAFLQHDASLPEFSIRGEVIAAAKGRLLGAMRQDVTLPHLPERRAA